MEHIISSDQAQKSFCSTMLQLTPSRMTMCPIRYYVEYIEGIKAFSQNKYSMYGNIVHSFVDQTIKGNENYNIDNIVDRMMVDVILRLFQIDEDTKNILESEPRLWKKLQVDGFIGNIYDNITSSLNDIDINQAMDDARFISSHMPRDATSEVSISCNYNTRYGINVKLYGRVDAIYNNTIYEFKTGKKYDPLQVSVYRSIMENNGMDGVKIVIIMTKTKSIIEPNDDVDIDKYIHSVARLHVAYPKIYNGDSLIFLKENTLPDSVLEVIDEMSLSVRVDKFKCMYCPFRQVCPASSNDLLES